MSYSDFLAAKRRVESPKGLERIGDLSSVLFPWQRSIVRWALRKGRAAIFADCGLGKTFMQLEWARSLGGRVLILAPLCVAEQTVDEAMKLGIIVRYARNAVEAIGAQLVITNYERLGDFDLSDYAGVVLDESSILKAFDGAMRNALIAACANVRYRLCCTATPSPNDIAELANHAEFLGFMTRPEFLATWFVKVDQGLRTTTHHGWRLKGHAREPFYRWLSSWAIAFRQPSDLGYSDDGFVLPSLTIQDHVIESTSSPSGVLFPEMGLKGLGGRLAERRGVLETRVAAAADLPNRHAPACSWLLWCGLNTESDAAVAAIPRSVAVSGSDDYDAKVAAVRGFVAGEIRTLISKPRILGYGMNFQHCHHMVFVGLNDSYEQYLPSCSALLALRATASSDGPRHRLRGRASHRRERAAEGNGRARSVGRLGGAHAGL